MPRLARLGEALRQEDKEPTPDWGLLAPTDGHRRDLLEIVEERYDRRSAIVTSQLPVGFWHDAIGDPTLANAILDHQYATAQQPTACIPPKGTYRQAK
jgi:hypothetical protein